MLARGGVIGGTSAGASILASFLVHGDTRSNETMIGDHAEPWRYHRIRRRTWSPSSAGEGHHDKPLPAFVADLVGGRDQEAAPPSQRAGPRAPSAAYSAHVPGHTVSLPPVGHVVYLHGFASSPASSKATRFARELAARGVGFSCPDLNEPAFETLTVTRMLTAAAREIAAAPGPVALVGSSLGGFVAVHAAALDRTGRVDRLILMAPAFDFGGNRRRQLGEAAIDDWRRRGTLSVFHYAHGEPRDIGFALYEDAAQYDAFALSLAQPMLIFQGRRDATVDPDMVAAWAGPRATATLRMLDDDHQLAGSIETIWKESAAFLGLDRGASS